MPLSAMSLGWTVAVYREGSIEAPDYWECAIPSYIEAERAVRIACASEAIALISAFEPISAEVVRLLNLMDGEVRIRRKLG